MWSISIIRLQDQSPICIYRPSIITRDDGEKNDGPPYTHPRSNLGQLRPGNLAVAGLSLLAALAGSLDLNTAAQVERAAPASPAEMPDWRGNSASLPGRN
jgi:hypothetical protein